MCSTYAHKVSPLDGIPVMPNGSWGVGHYFQLFRQEESFLSACRPNGGKKGDSPEDLHKMSVENADDLGRCTFWMGSTPGLSVTRYEDVQTLLKVSSHRETFPKITSLHTKKTYGAMHLSELTGDEWKTKRTAIIKALHQPRVLENNQYAYRRAANILTQSIREDRIKLMEDFAWTMKMLSFDAFGISVLNKDFGCCRHSQASQLMEDVDFLASEVTRRTTKDLLNPASHIYALPTPANLRHSEATKNLNSYIYGVIEERFIMIDDGAKADELPPDLLTSLIKHADMARILRANQEEDDDDEDDDEERIELLVEVVKSLLFSSYQTSSATLTFILYLLSQHREVEERCVAEIQMLPQKHVYLEAVIKETLRLYPPVISTTRVLEREVRFGGMLVPKDMYLYVPIAAIHRDERNFPRPLEFLPERWVEYDDDKEAWVPREYGESQEENEDDEEEEGRNEDCEDLDDIPVGNPKAFVAFSSGSRSCAGQRHAFQEMSIILSVLLRNFKFRPANDYELRLQREGSVQFPKGEMAMKISKR